MTKITNKGVFIPEQASAATDVAANSQIWAKTTVGGSILMHTNDAGVDHNINGITRSADFSTATGTTVSLTGIPLGVESIDLLMEGCSTNGSGEWLIQLGTASGLETSGYRSQSTDDNGSNDNRTTHCIFTFSVASGDLRDGILSFRLKDITNNTWVWSGSHADNTTPAINFAAGSKSLGGALTQMALTNTAGNTWDAGDIVLLYS